MAKVPGPPYAEHEDVPAPPERADVPAQPRNDRRVERILVPPHGHLAGHVARSRADGVRAIVQRNGPLAGHIRFLDSTALRKPDAHAPASGSPEQPTPRQGRDSDRCGNKKGILHPIATSNQSNAQPIACERSYVLEGSAGEHEPQAVARIVARMAPGK